MEIRAYRKSDDEEKLMQMIRKEEGWGYAEDNMSEKYANALENSITYVAYEEDVLCGFSRSVNDNGIYVYVCELLVRPEFRGRTIGRMLMECIYKDRPDQVAYFMSDVDEYYNKLNYRREGSVFKVNDPDKKLKRVISS